MSRLFKLYIFLLISILLSSTYGCISYNKENSKTAKNNTVSEKFKNIEKKYGVKLGIAVIDSATNGKILYNAEDRFPFCSTGKVMVVSSVLAKSMKDPNILNKKIDITLQDVEKSGYAPITKEYVEKKISVTELCKAAIEYSDNAATNILLNNVSNINEVNKYARSLGDNTFRLDRNEPGLNSAIPGDILDTTTPEAMAVTLEKIVLGNSLAFKQKELLITWLKGNTTGDKKIRAGVPSNWIVGDKTGGGAYGVNNDIGVVWPPDAKPIIMVLYSRTNDKDAKRNDKVISAATSIIVNALKNKE